MTTLSSGAYDTQQPPLLPLDPAIRHVWSIKLALLSAVAISAVLAYDIGGLFSGGRALPIGVLSALVACVASSVTIVLPRLRFKFWAYDLRLEELYLERGIFNRVRSIVPVRRIQHIDISQDIVEREFGLGKLIVHTAGTRSSDVVLPGLRMERAEEIRDLLKKHISDDAL